MGWLVRCLVGCLVRWMVGCLVGWLELEVPAKGDG